MIGNTLLYRDLDPEDQPTTEPPPMVPLELVEYLERTFPNRLPDLRIEDRELGAAIGRQQIITLLRELTGKRT